MGDPHLPDAKTGQVESDAGDVAGRADLHHGGRRQPVRREPVIEIEVVVQRPVPGIAALRDVGIDRHPFAS